MNRLIVLAFSLLAAVGTAHAASVTNNDAEARIIVVTEDGAKSEISIAAGEKADICPAGCFVTWPNGDRAALKGDENVAISNGKPILQ